jgi:hypothetical protein
MSVLGTPLGANARQTAGRNGGARQRSLASRRRFCAVAVSRTSSLAPLNALYMCKPHLDLLALPT